MKRKLIYGSLILGAAISIAIPVIGVLSPEMIRVKGFGDTHTFTFNETTNRVNYTSDPTQCSDKSLTFISDANNDIDFIAHNLIAGESGDWQKCGYNTTGSAGYLYNETKLTGITSICVDFDEMDGSGSTPAIQLYSSLYKDDVAKPGSHTVELNDLLDEIPFEFNDMLPSYFRLKFINVVVHSITINYACEDNEPSLDREDHWELVTSLSDINETDVYTIATAEHDEGYALNNSTNANNFKSLDSMSYHGEMLDRSDYAGDYLKFKFVENAGYYNLVTTNYGGTDGYFKQFADKKVQINTSNATNFDLSFDGNNLVLASVDGGYSSTTMFFNKSAKCFSLYHPNSYINTPSQFALVYLYKFISPIEYIGTIDSDALSSISGSYSTGNYGYTSFNGVRFEYYRGKATYDSYRLMHPNYYYGSPNAACIYNTDPIYGLFELDITFTSEDGLKIGYSTDVGVESYKTVTGSSTSLTRQVSLPYCNFFKIMDNGSDAYISNIEYHFTGIIDSHSTTKQTYSANRKAFTMYSGSYVPGSSQKTMYISETLTKTYTYYTYDYVEANPSCIDDAAMVDPIDVCNYFLAFGCAPANYGQQNTVNPLRDGETVPSKSEVNSLFGNKARAISQYSRTDGYALYVPYNNKYGDSKPLYYELDIDNDGNYTTSSRQVARVVAWDYGFSCYSDPIDHIPVCVYTDDHYATYQEYNNMGGFAPRFDAEKNLTGKQHSPLTIA